MNELFHELACLDKAANHAHFSLREERLIDLLDADPKIGLFRVLVLRQLRESNDFLFDQSPQLGDAAHELSLHVILNLLPRVHAFNRVHHDRVPLPERLEEDAGHASDGKDCRRWLLDTLELQEHLNVEEAHSIDRPSHLVETGSCGNWELRPVQGLSQLLLVLSVKQVGVASLRSGIDRGERGSSHR